MDESGGSDRRGVFGKVFGDAWASICGLRNGLDEWVGGVGC